MASLPIEIIPATDATNSLLERPLRLATALQTEFSFSVCRDDGLSDTVRFASTGEIVTSNLLHELACKRNESRGYHPFIIAFTEAFLRGTKLSNLFGSSRAESGLAVVTFHDVRKVVGDTDDAITGYALYYLARYAMGFASPQIKNHEEPRQCIYDRKDDKLRIIESFRSGAICDPCRNAMLSSGKGTIEQVRAVNTLIEHASSLVHRTVVARRPTVFIGSSTKSIEYAQALKQALGGDFDVRVWNEDQVFRLGGVTIEQLEKQVNCYDFGIFVMMPDDRIVSPEGERMVPRDNVVFEAGLFAGKLSRYRALILTVGESQISLPSDLNGLTTLRVERSQNLPGAVADAARRAASHMKYVFGESIGP